MDHIIKKEEKRFNLTPIFVVEVTHVPLREHLVDKIETQNQALAEVCNWYDHVHWIPTSHIYLTDDKKSIARYSVMTMCIKTKKAIECGHP